MVYDKERLARQCAEEPNELLELLLAIVEACDNKRLMGGDDTLARIKYIKENVTWGADQRQLEKLAEAIG